MSDLVDPNLPVPADDPYRSAVAQRLSELVERVEPPVADPSAHRAYERHQLVAQAQLEQWDALRSAIEESLGVELQDGAATAELRRQAGTPSAHLSVEKILTSRWKNRAYTSPCFTDWT